MTENALLVRSYFEKILNKHEIELFDNMFSSNFRSYLSDGTFFCAPPLL